MTKTFAAPPTAFDKRVRFVDGKEVAIVSATDKLKFKPNLDVEEARQAMIAAGQQPGNPLTKKANEARRTAFREAQLTGMSIADAKAVSQNAYDAVVSGQAPPTVVAAPPAPAAPVVSDGKILNVRTAADQRAGITQPVTTPTVRDLRAERIDTPQFYGEIKQDGGQWVAELVYKNGAGTERFAAPTKNALMFKLLEGKGHATVQVRRVTNDIKRRDTVQYEMTYKFEGLTQADYDRLSETAKLSLIAAQQDRAAIAFKEAHAHDYLASAYNSEKIMEFLNKRQAVITLGNLEKAFEELSANDELEVRTETVTPYVPEGAAELEDSSTPVTAAPVVSTPVAPVTPEPVVRKRGTLGLMPGFASSPATAAELDETEDGTQPRELSAAELKKLTPEEHRRLYQASLAANKKTGRSF
jgi:hypothetical protein